MEAAARISLGEIQTRYREWVDDLDKVDREIVTAEQDRQDRVDEAKYTESLTFFYNSALEQQEVRPATRPCGRVPRRVTAGRSPCGFPVVQDFKANLDRLERHAEELATLFGEEKGDVEPQAILSTLNIFLKRLEKAHEEVRRRKDKGAGTKAPKARHSPPHAMSGSAAPDASPSVGSVSVGSQPQPKQTMFEHVQSLGAHSLASRGSTQLQEASPAEPQHR